MGSTSRHAFLGVVIALAIVTLLKVLDTPTNASVSIPAVATPGVNQERAVLADPWPYLGESNNNSTRIDALMQNNYYLVLDGSGSMSERKCSAGETKMEAAKKAVYAFGDAVAPNANLGLISFSDGGVVENMPLGTNNREEFARQISKLDTGGETPLRSAIQLAYDRLTAQARTQLGYGEYHLVVITDGEASSGEEPASLVNKIIDESPVVIHTIGFCIDTRHSLNQVGRTYYQSAIDPVSLAQGLADVLAEAPQFNATQFQ